MPMSCQMLSRLSLPPEASWRPSGDHFRPQTCPNKPPLHHEPTRVHVCVCVCVRRHKTVSNLLAVCLEAADAAGRPAHIVMEDAAAA